ncbi:MAG: TonB-dependent receptor [Bacteroidales bacterium]
MVQAINRQIIRQLFVVLLLILSKASFAQVIEPMIDSSFQNQGWKNFVQTVESRFGIQMYYYADSIPDFQLKGSYYPIRLNDFLSNNLQPKNIHFTYSANGDIFITGHQNLNSGLRADFFQITQNDLSKNDSIAEKSKTDFLQTTRERPAQSVVIGSAKKTHTNHPVVFTGRVTNIDDKKPIEGATVFIREIAKGTLTNESGHFSITIPSGKYTLIINSIENKETRYELSVYSDGFAEFTLEPEIYSLDEVVIRSEREDHLRSTNTGFERITAKSLKEIPAVMGERDIIRVALLLPGVQSVGEGSSGFNVRGAPSDQNMFYISKIPIYNTSHLLGFFSAFNPDVVSDFTLHKGNIPSTYGGRLSAIFNIEAKEGNMEKFSVRGGISPITARLSFETPIIKNKLSVLAGFRSTYSDWALQMVKNPEIKNSKAGFQDFVTNISYNINKNNKLSVFGYYSNDMIKIVDKTKFNYSNAGASMSWLHAFNQSNNFTFSFAQSNYTFAEENTQTAIGAFTQSYSLNHSEAKLNFSFHPGEKHTIETGLSSVLYQLNHGPFLPFNDSSLVYPKQLENEKGMENALYLQEEWKILPTLTMVAGLRYNLFTNLGPKTVFVYESGLPRSIETITDTLLFTDNQPTKTYTGLDYRFSTSYQINPEMSLKMSYNRVHQYIFMLSNTIALSPTDKWKLADYNIKPMIGDQISVGYYTLLNRETIEASAEIYYKNTENLVEFKDGANLLINEHPEMDLVQGNLKAYGIEFMLKKPRGKLNGWINYTYSKSIIQVNDPLNGELVNFGLRFPANFDKPHSFNAIANLKLSKRISVSGNIVYSTGRPITYPTAIYYQNGQQFLHYSKRNEYRIPDYFRTDLSVVLEGNLKKKKFIHGSWIFSVYNVTGRKNAYSVYFEAVEGVIKSYRLSVFGAPIFSLTYDFKLGNYAD